jgi:hypothetical protein
MWRINNVCSMSFALIPSSVVRISLLSCVSYSLHTSYIHPYMQVPGLICHPFLWPNCCFRVTIQRDECQIDIWIDGYATLLGGTLLYRRMISVDILKSAPLCDASAMGQPGQHQIIAALLWFQSHLPFDTEICFAILIQEGFLQWVLCKSSLHN